MDRELLLVLLGVTLVLFFLKLYLEFSYVDSGEKLYYLQQETHRLKTENTILREKVLLGESFHHIASAAASLGLTKRDSIFLQ